MAEIFQKWALFRGEKTSEDFLASATKIPEPLIPIFEQRGLKSGADIDRFLYPKLSSLPLPETLLGMEKAVDLICAARESGRRVVIFGDYDVDGTTSTSLLVNFFKKIGITVTYVHPDRLKDGYSLSDKLVQQIGIENPDSLLVTVDCGISSNQAIKLAKSLGLDVIVTDHHLPPEELPEADAIINPRQPGCQFVQKDLAGVGVAFYLVAGVRARLREAGLWTKENQPDLKEELDLVAIGSVADMVPLRGVNRILVINGLELINSHNCHRAGLLALLEICHITNKEINSDDIGYQIGPRINAAGRLKNATLATELFLASSWSVAIKLAQDLDVINNERKKMAKELTEKAIALAETQVEEGRDALILHGDDWHHGLLGIVASRLVEKFKKPTIILGGFPVAKGSGRTIPALNLYDTLKGCREHLLQFGGHKQAAGLTISCDNITKFTNHFNKLASEHCACDDVSELHVDASLAADKPIGNFFEIYRLLGPFGVGNPEPVFMLDEPCYLRNVSAIGKGKNHLKFSIRILGAWLTGIGFGFGELAEALRDNKVNIAFSLRDNWFRGNRTIQVCLQDVKISCER